MKPSLRQILADYHVSAVAIAVLLYWSLYWGFSALWSLLAPAANFLVTAVAIVGIPYGSFTFTGADRLVLTLTLIFLSNALVCLAAAWVLSRWVYRTGPLRSLSEYRTKLTRRNHA